MNSNYRLVGTIEAFLRPLFQSIDSLATLRPYSWTLLVVIIAASISYVTKPPKYTGHEPEYPGSFTEFPSSNYGKAITWWLEHPFRQVPVGAFYPEGQLFGIPAGEASHLDKLSFRATIPTINLIFGGGVWALVVASHLAALLIFWATHRLIWLDTRDAPSAALTTWTLAATWSGTFGFNDFSYGDAVAVLFLLLAMIFRRPWLISTVMIAAAFTDERAVLAAPLVAFYIVGKGKPLQAFAPDWNLIGVARQASPVITAVLVYGAIRVGIFTFRDVDMGTTMLATLEILRYHIMASYPTRIFDVFETLWIWPALLCIYLFNRERQSFWLLTYGAAMLFAATPAVLVYDIDRSLFYLLPGVLTACALLPLPTNERRLLLAVGFVVSLTWIHLRLSALRLAEPLIMGLSLTQ